MIVKDLMQEGICFAVVQSVTGLTRHSTIEGKEYEIVALSKDVSSYSRFVMNSSGILPKSHQNPDGVSSSILSYQEVQEFLELKDGRFLTHRILNGAVYDLIENPFKDYYNEYRN